MAKTKFVLEFKDKYIPLEIPKEKSLSTNERVVIEIYKITCIVTQKSYVGQAVSHKLNAGKYRKYGTEGRFKSHVTEAINNTKKKQCRLLNNSIRKHGPENFTYELLRICSHSQDYFETEAIIEHKTLAPNGYNLKLGGQTFIHTVESRKIVSNGVKKYYDEKRFEKYKSTIIPKNIDPFSLIHVLRRDEKQYGYYVLYNRKGRNKIKSDFGGVNIALEESFIRAVNFVKFLQTKPKLRNKFT